MSEGHGIGVKGRPLWQLREPIPPPLLESIMVYITHIRLSPPTSNDHQHITRVKWLNPTDQNTQHNSVTDMVAWIETQKGVARVTDGVREVDVGVVHPDSGAAYLRTHADGRWSNNLLALPRF